MASNSFKSSTRAWLVRLHLQSALHKAHAGGGYIRSSLEEEHIIQIDITSHTHWLWISVLSFRRGAQAKDIALSSVSGYLLGEAKQARQGKAQS